MKPKILLSLLLIVVFIVSVIAHLPARLAVNYLPASTGIVVTGVEGSLWKGSAKNVTWKNRSLGTLSWDANLLRLFTGKADVSIALRGGIDGIDGKGRVGYSLSGPYASNLFVSAPAEAVMKNAPIPVPVSASGSLNLLVKDYQFASPWCAELDGSLNWVNGNVSSPMGDIKAGDVAAQLSCVDGSIAAKGDSKSSALTSEFSLELSPNQRYKVNGWLAPGSEFPPQLRSQLGFLGRPDSNGRYKLNFNG
ncbi:general secretion pathway protein GspN [Veronia nyctiphanis]|uniref:Type II secretion system protein N n=1 Tax=Veronia nyctiphanis TaxID=1278244 RepID=A0A4Q0YP30_9GAMM|nr:type II secretion system protein N [Veronia nyctiphanis]RXJ72666.1 general secretion pathway protein GspN [Veronia nyctiphanis]